MCTSEIYLVNCWQLKAPFRVHFGIFDSGKSLRYADGRILSERRRIKRIWDALYNFHGLSTSCRKSRANRIPFIQHLENALDLYQIAQKSTRVSLRDGSSFFFFSFPRGKNSRAVPPLFIVHLCIKRHELSAWLKRKCKIHTRVRIYAYTRAHMLYPHTISYYILHIFCITKYIHYIKMYKYL